MSWFEVREEMLRGGPLAQRDAHACCDRLEAGEILFFPQGSGLMSGADLEFLTSQKQSDWGRHKNISYRPAQGVVRGFASNDHEHARRLREVLGAFSRNATVYLSDVLQDYAGKWSLDFASFRPIQEHGRNLPLTKRNDLLHVDAFPTRPTRGARILRFFLNIHHEEARVWVTAGPFAELAARFGAAAGLLPAARAQRSFLGAAERLAARALAPLGLMTADRTAYDKVMLKLHDVLKADEWFQEHWPKQVHRFPPGSGWAVFTDSVAHAVLSGQHALEQTFLVPVEAMRSPELSPLYILESQCGLPLVDKRTLSDALSIESPADVLAFMSLTRSAAQEKGGHKRAA